MRKVQSSEEDQMDLVLGPWTVEEDFKLINYRGFCHVDDDHFPGRTDNEIKNYWRTRVQKHAKQLKCDVSSKQFKDTMRYLWMPRLVERIQAASVATATTNSASQMFSRRGVICDEYTAQVTPENSSTVASSSNSFEAQVSPVSDLTNCYNNGFHVNNNPNPGYSFQYGSQVDYSDLSEKYYNSNNNHGDVGIDFPTNNHQPMLDGGDLSDNLLNADDFLFLQQQFNFNM
ncbi:Ubiquitin protein ligase 6 isoform 1 [Hibiscus syriacus]|uniref:Ubiquitin protein ligase 6 isoform 1 n=1 Tax=Hibiscus syriacus TaxID=106335 RepID=A0A6A3D0H0_HIBSY|nr:Ubiquitin protein ligase 6 isoform 1 [Hibiscus syriacus]